MDLSVYRNFITIVECGNLSAAAEHLHIAQPALTTQMKNLQKSYGTTLMHIKRGARNIELTDAGSILYNKAKFLLALESDAHREIAACEKGTASKLRISLSPSMSILFVQNFLAGFSKLNPGIQYDLYEVPIQEQTEQLLSGMTEIGVANAPLIQTHRFETLYQKKERLAVICHKNSAFFDTNHRNLVLEDLEDAPLCLSRGCSQLFFNICSDSQLYPHILSISTTKLSALMWAQQNIGVAIVPMSTGEYLPPDLVYHFIQDDRMYLSKTLSIVKDRPLSPVAKNFINYYLTNT